MKRSDKLDPLLERFEHHVQLYEQGDLTSRELIVDLLIKLGKETRFDLAEQTVGVLPKSLRAELAKTVDEILEHGESYRGLFIIGRASDEWWHEVRSGVKLLAEILKPILDKQLNKGSWKT